MKKSVCVEAVFEGKDFIASMRDIKDAGYPAIEFWTWWDKDVNAISAAKDELGLDVATFCTKFISLVDPACIEDYRQGLAGSIQAAKQLGCTTLISQVGNDTGAPRAQQYDVMVAGLKSCVPMLEESGITLVIEPLNIKVDHPGYFMVLSGKAFDVVERVGSPNVKVLFDMYHQQISEGDILPHILPNLDKIGHFHVAGNPGRHEITDGELHFQNIFKAIDKAGYTGYTGLEYFPLRDAKAGIVETKDW